MVLGHLTVTSAGRRVLQRRWPRVFIPLGPLLLGAYLPDLLDKPLNMAFGLPGRAFGHSLVVELAIFTAAGLALPRLSSGPFQRRRRGGSWTASSTSIQTVARSSGWRQPEFCTGSGWR
jgi:hypothetical protein